MGELRVADFQAAVIWAGGHLYLENPCAEVLFSFFVWGLFLFPFSVVVIPAVLAGNHVSLKGWNMFPNIVFQIVGHLLCNVSTAENSTLFLPFKN